MENNNDTEKMDMPFQDELSVKDSSVSQDICSISAVFDEFIAQNPTDDEENNLIIQKIKDFISKRLDEPVKNSLLKIDSLHKQISSLRSKLIEEKENVFKSTELFRDEQFAKVSEDIDFIRKSKLESLEKEIEELRKAKLSDLETREKNLEAIRHSCMQMETEANICKLKYEAEYAAMSSREELLEKRKQDLEIEAEAHKKDVETYYRQKEVRLSRLIDDLRTDVVQSNAALDSYATLTEKLGNQDPLALLSKLKDSETALQRARQELEEYSNHNAEAEIKKLNKIIDELRVSLQEARDRNHNLELSTEDLNLKAALEKMKRENEICTSQLNSAIDYSRILEERMRKLSSEGNPSARKKRIEDLEGQHFFNRNEIGQLLTEEIIELDWLDDIKQKSDEYGIVFPKRLLKAFHTSLKCAEWSPLVILSGFSGTGKSVLPKIYSRFGGFLFDSVAVQPNWDSKESMLGFFNSIDNRFDAQPLLRFLVQSSQSNNNGSTLGLKDSMNMVLLDEMNLAHVELYFADFLSKLEERRDCGEDVPCLDISLGAGLEPYQIPLNRNLLWVGTMNQDETTKSLSDKVLDRGNILFFPSPKTFVRRTALKRLPETGSVKRLPYKIWKGWIRSCLAPEFEHQTEKYKRAVEMINDALGTVGRALGHRVWQSIEYYMNNHPDVISASDEVELSGALQTSFEDAFVQKIVPKLRGIDTVGQAKNACLDKIKETLDERGLSLGNDFEKACSNPYGQFIWTSADYLDSNK